MRNNQKPKNKITLVANAPAIVKEKLQSNEFRALKISSEKRGKDNHITIYTISFQNLVTQLGLIVSGVVNGKKITGGTFPESIDFLCLELLRDKQLRDYFYATRINQTANNIKHTTQKNNDISVDDTVMFYNRLVNNLIKLLNLPELKQALLSDKPEKPLRIFEEKPHVKYEMIGDHRVKFYLTPKYELDPYTKSATVNLEVTWEKAEDFELRISITSTKTDEVLKVHEIMMDSGSKESIEFAITEDELSKGNTILKVNVHVLLMSIYDDNYWTKSVYETVGRGIFKRRKLVSEARYKEVKRRKEETEKSFTISNKLSKPI